MIDMTTMKGRLGIPAKAPDPIPELKAVNLEQSRDTPSPARPGKPLLLENPRQYYSLGSFLQLTQRASYFVSGSSSSPTPGIWCTSSLSTQPWDYSCICFMLLAPQ